ncbi:MAG: glycosyltransferase family 39 protein [Elusimicrobia bacterium]|nr:glycosyltransferase family 39 protein [Elusimicrobiota bacterium]
MDYIEKPPLIYWLGALSYKALGVSEAAGRLPLAILAILGMAGIIWIASWLPWPKNSSGERRSHWTPAAAGIILGTCAEYSLLSHLQTPDMAVSVCLLWACAFILRSLALPNAGGWTGPAAGVAMGLAFLSKGLIGVLFPCLWSALIWIFVPEWRGRFRFPRILGAAAACLLVALPWVVAMSQRHPDFPVYFFLHHHFARYLTSHYDRPGGWYYYIGVNAAGLLPWTPLAWAAMLGCLTRWRKLESSLRALLLWPLFILLFFTTSHSKLPTYILPIFPHQCLLTAYFLNDLSRQPKSDRWVRAAGLGLAALLTACIPIAFWLRRNAMLPEMIAPEILWIGGFTLAVIAAALAFTAWTRQEDGGATLLRRVAFSAMAMTALLLIGARRMEPYLSARAAAQEIQARWRPGDRIVSYDFYLHAIPFYLRRPVDRLVNWRGEFRLHENDPRYQDRFGDLGALATLPALPGRSFVLMPRRVAREFTTLFKPGRIREMRTFGNTVLAVL